MVLFYAFSVFWGFVNYTVGLAVAFWVLALYASAGARTGRKLAAGIDDENGVAGHPGLLDAGHRGGLGRRPGGRHR